MNNNCVCVCVYLSYIDKAIMEVKTDEFGSDSDVTESSLLNNALYNGVDVRACGIVECGTKLSI